MFNEIEMTKKKLISVIIPTYRDWSRLKHCLGALDKQNLSKDDFEILVVNNDPEDPPPRDFLFPTNATLLTESIPGSYAARNRAIRYAHGEFFAFTDSDCQPQPDWLINAIRCMREDEDVTRVGGYVELMIPDDVLTIAQVYEKVFAFRQQDHVREQGMAVTANMVVKKTVFDKVGLFDQKLFSGGDSEWGQRASAAGSKIVYNASCVVNHPSRKRLSSIVLKTRRMAGGKFQMERHRNIIFQWMKLFVGFMPPVSSIKKVVFDERFTLKEKIIALSVRYFLRIVFHYEKALLMLSVKKQERL